MRMKFFVLGMLLATGCGTSLLPVEANTNHKVDTTHKIEGDVEIRTVVKVDIDICDDIKSQKKKTECIMELVEVLKELSKKADEEESD
jgi:hypothetical protein